MSELLRVGIAGTSWWADGMFLPAVNGDGESPPHPRGRIVAVCGRDAERTAAFAQKWNLPEHFTDYQAMIASGKIDAIIVATPNDSHYPITMAALDAGLHVICDKPLALNYEEAQAMADRASAVGVKTMVPFTHRWMPIMRYTKQLLDEDYVGQPYFLNMRYYASGARREGYRWRNDKAYPGSGVLQDLGPHLLHLARWFYGEVVGLSCTYAGIVKHEGYESADDVALLNMRFANGALGALTMTMLTYAGNTRGQTQHLEFHGSAGTLNGMLDWDTVQELRGAREPGATELLPVPDALWGDVRRDTVQNTLDDVMRRTPTMTREWIDAILDDKPSYPDFGEGARVQHLLDAAAHSAENGSVWMDV